MLSIKFFNVYICEILGISFMKCEFECVVVLVCDDLSF